MSKPHELPKQEDVTEIQSGDGFRLEVVKLTPENRPSMLEVALSMYCGEACKYCGHVYETTEDLRARDARWAGYHERGRLACGMCWKENNP